MQLPRIARRIFPDWNVRIYSPLEAQEYCRQKKVQVVDGDDDEVDFGLYTVYRDLEWIVLNRNLDPVMKYWVFLHEIFHKTAHAPATSYFSPGMESKNDCEANHFSAVSMMPKPMLEEHTIEEICGIYQIPRPLVLIRKSIADNYCY